MLLTREDILQADDIQRETVACPEWGGDVLVRGLTAKQRDEYESSLVLFKGKNQEINMKQARTKLAVLAICDESGLPLFSDADIAALSAKSAKPLDRIFDVARRLSGLSEEDVEELTKNSESGPSGDSSSG